MDQPPLPQRDQDADPDRVDVLFRPVATLRSPIVARRSVRFDAAASPVSRPDAPSVSLPTARELLRAVLWAGLAAAPIVLLFGWPPAILIGLLAAAIRAVNMRVGRVTFSFGDGFLPFRAYNRWPHGVQEEDDVRWNWSTVHHAPSGQARG